MERLALGGRGFGYRFGDGAENFEHSSGADDLGKPGRVHWVGDSGHKFKKGMVACGLEGVAGDEAFPVGGLAGQ